MKEKNTESHTAPKYHNLHLVSGFLHLCADMISKYLVLLLVQPEIPNQTSKLLNPYNN